MSIALDQQLERDDNRAEVLRSVRDRAACRAAEQIIGAIDATVRHLRTMRHGLQAEFGANVSPGGQSAEATAISGHWLDNAFGTDAVNDLPLDYDDLVADCGGDLLNGDDEIAVDEVRRWVRTALKNLAGTNE